MIKAVIFDYDGVIVDSFGVLYDIYKKIFKELGIQIPPDIETFRSDFGYNYLVYFKSLGMSMEQRQRASEIYLKEVVKRNPPCLMVFKKCLKQLKINI